MPKTLLSVQQSDSTLWLNGADGACVARFGRYGFEITGTHGHSSADGVGISDWKEFQRIVYERFGVTLEKSHCPRELRNANDETDDVCDNYLISVATLRRRFDPYRRYPWGVGSISLEDVDAMLRTDVRRNESEWFDDYSVSDHVARIAFLVEETQRCGHLEPIVLSCQYSSGDLCELIDGHHRLAASIFLYNLDPQAHRFILATYDGFGEAFRILFPKASLALRSLDVTPTSPVSPPPLSSPAR